VIAVRAGLAGKSRLQLSTSPGLSSTVHYYLKVETPKGKRLSFNFQTPLRFRIDRRKRRLSANVNLIQLLPLRLRSFADLEMFSLQRQLGFLAIAIGPVAELVAVPRSFQL